MKHLHLFRTFLPTVAKTVLILIAILASSCSSDDAPGENTSMTYEGDLHISSEYALINFAQSGYEAVNGSVYIQSQTLTNLEGLENLKVIHDQLIIQESDNLVDISALDNLTDVGSIYINLKSITSINAFSNLKEIWGNDLIPAITLICPQLQDLTAFKNLERARKVIIRGCNSLENLSGLDSLQELESLTLDFNENLKTPAGMPSLSQLGELLVLSSAGFVDFEGLSPQITSLNHLKFSKGYTSMGGSLRGLENITSVNYFDVYATISSFEGIENLTNVSTFILIAGTMPSLQGLNLQSVDALHLSYTKLENLEGIENITSLTNLSLYANQELTSLQGLHNLASVDNISITSNSRLADISGLSGLTTLGHTIGTGIIKVRENALTSLNGLQNVTAFKGTIDVWEPELTDFCALQSILANGEFQNVWLYAGYLAGPTPEEILAGDCTIE